MKSTLALALATFASITSAQYTVPPSAWPTWGACDHGINVSTLPIWDPLWQAVHNPGNIDPLIPIIPPCKATEPARFVITTEAIELQPGVTVDFADTTGRMNPGPLKGYIYVKVQGEYVLIPYYALR